MVLAFAAHGADVVIASRKLDACAALAKEVIGTTGRDAAGIVFNASVWGDAERLADAVYERFGRCDVLVNNAGMSPLYPALTDVTEEMFDKVVGVNFKGPFRLSALIGERMVGGGGGSIINISSIAAVQPAPTSLAYACAKAALNAMTTGLAFAYGPTVRANVIMPGAFLTDISKAWNMEEFNRKALTLIPARRAAEPHEIVGAALYLASAASSYTSGAVIKVDGGRAYSPG
jgi:NAD(P)-dependent dehydrogenase (short-subunit alcohol dehydrogenase family)